MDECWYKSSGTGCALLILSKKKYYRLCCHPIAIALLPAENKTGPETLRLSLGYQFADVVFLDQVQHLYKAAPVLIGQVRSP